MACGIFRDLDFNNYRRCFLKLAAFQSVFDNQISQSTGHIALEAVINQHWAVNIDHKKELGNPNAILLVAEKIEPKQNNGYWDIIDVAE